MDPELALPCAWSAPISSFVCLGMQSEGDSVPAGGGCGPPPDGQFFQAGSRLNMRRLFVVLLSFFVALILTGGLSWFAVRNYRSAAPMAEENLRGLALTLAGAMEGLASRDSSLASLNSLVSPEVAYAVLISAKGEIIFHTNADLIGSEVDDSRYLPVVRTGAMREGRIRLGTGETVYEFQSPFHYSGEVWALRLALHTWRAEAVMRRARQGLTVIFSLLAVGWIMGGSIVWLLHRQAVRERLAERRKELTRLGEVGAVLAHEVRNPLAGIKGYAQLLLERLPAGREHDFADLIVNESRRLEGLVDDILFYTGGEPDPLATVDLDKVCSEVLTLLKPQAEASDVRINRDLPARLVARCPAEEMRRVLLNLLNNALQASPRQGVISVAAQRTGNKVELTVADQGGGIPEAMREELFLPFRTSKPRGSGLGLAICRKIVDGCGGSIRAEAAPGGGALFRVLLPAADEPITEPSRDSLRVHSGVKEEVIVDRKNPDR
jgi:two-component system sensor histidine kinase HydH